MNTTDYSFSETPAPGEFVLSRTFDAPRELLWKVHTEAEHLLRWWGPKGVEVRILELDVRPGGAFRYAMRPPGGAETFGKFAYQQIVAPEFYTTVVGFTDAEGAPARHPMSPVWPLECFIHKTFTEKDGRTTISQRSIPLVANDLERQAFEDGHERMRQGFNGMLDQLAAYLPTL